ncbi:MAG: MFS transporter [Chloroflexi bacterium]|nr:MFS transporter [Chloroflexota bacterium]
MDTAETVSQPKAKRRHYYGWVIVIVMALVGFTQSAETHPVISVFLKPITTEFHWSRTLFTGAITVGTLAGGALALIIGPTLDRFGPRWVITVAFALLGASLLLMAFMNTLWQFYALQVIGRTVTMGAIALAGSVVIPKWFVARRGRAVALSGLGGRLGNAVTPLYVQFLVSKGNWRIAAAMTGVLTWAVSMIPAALFLRRRPEDMGLLPDGRDPVQSKDPPTSDSGKPASQRKADSSYTVRQVLREPSFYLLAGAFSLMFIAAPALNLHQIPYMTDKGISNMVAVSSVVVLSVFGGVGSLAFGFMAERIPVRVTLAGTFFFMAIGFLTLLAVNSAANALLWSAYYGLVSGGMGTLQQVIMADYYGRDSLGAIRGVVWPTQMIFNAFGPMAAAMAYDATGNYVAIFTVFGVLVFGSTILVFLAKPPRARATSPL